MNQHPTIPHLFERLNAPALRLDRVRDMLRIAAPLTLAALLLATAAIAVTVATRPAGAQAAPSQVWCDGLRHCRPSNYAPTISPRPVARPGNATD